MQTIVSENQKNILAILGEEKDIVDNFYFGGGTALSELYLHHRFSEDLDFFSEKEINPLALSVFFKKIQKRAGIIKVEYTRTFNRNLFFLEMEKEMTDQREQAKQIGQTKQTRQAQQIEKIKTEFTYFPFPRIEEKEKLGNLSVDSLHDIAVNKVFTIYQNPRSRDFIDLYCILQKKDNWTIDDLVKQAQIKFDTYIDPIQLGSQYIKAKELKDYPRMIVPIRAALWQDFFIEEAKKLKNKIIE